MPKILAQVECSSFSDGKRLSDRDIQCERLSDETRSWIFIGAQHPHANRPFLHYSSERLLREAPKQASQIAGTFNTLCTNLVASRRQDTLALAQQLSATREAKKAIELILQKQRSEIEDKDAQIATYRSMLGQGPSGL